MTPLPSTPTTNLAFPQLEEYMASLQMLLLISSELMALALYLSGLMTTSSSVFLSLPSPNIAPDAKTGIQPSLQMEAIYGTKVTPYPTTYLLSSTRISPSPSVIGIPLIHHHTPRNGLPWLVSLVFQPVGSLPICVPHSNSPLRSGL